MSTDVARVTGRTALLAILADPVEQARTPGLVNAALARRGCDAVLVPLHVAVAGLPPVLAGLRATRNFRGCVVSMPHKVAATRHVDRLTAAAREVDACNVIRRTPDGQLVGTMFDGEGFVAGLRTAGHEVRGKRVFLGGAGGAAAAIAFALARHGARTLTVYNRTAGRAEALVAKLRAAWEGVEVAAGRPDACGHEIAVNATSLGMRADDPLPFAIDGIGRGDLVAEVVIRAEPTPLLAQAAARGCVVHPGLPMLVAQIEMMVDFMLEESLGD